MEERRRSKRLSMSGKIIIKEMAGKEAVDEATIEILNCSRHGLGFNCNKQLMIGNNYEAYLTIWTMEVLHVFLQIVRSEQFEEGIYNYGCIFIGMPDADRQRISVYETVEELIPHEKD
ncbi:PilZ domain-containing protein [Butyrivibrio sp. MC2013]|uniref:PilZ domain-containing protein n=1 Tax=Butyrivibrio sp. MC2013 TaxID=1280686 RepID=UPI000412A266|nr:PilZ domain-containing protein [Butyrivibrio sp. MC2013]